LVTELYVIESDSLSELARKTGLAYGVIRVDCVMVCNISKVMEEIESPPRDTCCIVL